MSQFVRPEVDAFLELPPLLRALRPTLNDLGQPVYLVGGLVRDILLGLGGNDLDLAVAQQGIRTAFKLGNKLNAPAYAMDKERDVGRVVLAETDIDVARFRGESLEADLQDRDFTINAIALPTTGERFGDLIDPTNGINDLADGIVRQVSEKALRDDPLRTLRAIRIALKFGFSIEPKTWQTVQAVGAEIGSCSPERRRDELVKLFSLPAPGVGVERLEAAGMSEQLLPALAVDVVAELNIVAQLQADMVNGASGDDRVAALLEALGDERAVLLGHWNRPVDGGHTGSLLLRLATLLHAQTETSSDPFQFLTDYRFSNEVLRYVKTVVNARERLLDLRGEGPLTRRQIYCYFKGVGPAGLDIAIFTLAKLYNQNDSDWHEFAELTAILIRAYSHDHDTVIKPFPLIRGDELMQELDLPPGPEVGRILEIIEEANAAGEIHTKQEALTLARAS